MAELITYHLVVISPFDGYARGDKITDEAECTRVLAGDNAHCVHRVLAD